MLLGTGRSSFTAWVCGGMVMMNMMSSTSMTSISGVVLMSIMGSPSAGPADIAIAKLLQNLGQRPDTHAYDGVSACEMKPTFRKPACESVETTPPMHL